MSCKCVKGTNLNIYFPTIEITVGSFNDRVKLLMNGEAYMYHDGVDKCVSHFREYTPLNDEQYWLVGMPLFRAFDVLHDGERSRLGFKKYKNGNVVNLIGADTDSATLSLRFSLLSLASITLF